MISLWVEILIVFGLLYYKHCCCKLYCTCLLIQKCQVFWGTYLGLESLHLRIYTSLVLLVKTKQFFKVAVPRYTPTLDVWEFLVISIFTSIWYYHTFLITWHSLQRDRGAPQNANTSLYDYWIYSEKYRQDFIFQNK